MMLMVLAAWSVPSYSAGSDNLTICKIYGTVEVQRGGSSEWRGATERQRLKPGDRVRTGASSWCFLQFSASNLLRLMEKSRMRILEISEGEKPVAGRGAFAVVQSTGVYHVDLEVGQAFPVMDRLQSRQMMLSTPIAVAGVRGTSFLATVEQVAADRKGSTCNVDFTVYTGTVAVMDLRQPDAGVTMLPAGYSLSFANVRVPAGGFGGGQAAAAGSAQGRSAEQGGEGANNAASRPAGGAADRSSAEGGARDQQLQKGEAARQRMQEAMNEGAARPAEATPNGPNHASSNARPGQATETAKGNRANAVDAAGAVKPSGAMAGEARSFQLPAMFGEMGAAHSGPAANQPGVGRGAKPGSLGLTITSAASTSGGKPSIVVGTTPTANARTATPGAGAPLTGGKPSSGVGTPPPPNVRTATPGVGVNVPNMPSPMIQIALPNIVKPGATLSGMMPLQPMPVPIIPSTMLTGGQISSGVSPDNTLSAPRTITNTPVNYDDKLPGNQDLYIRPQ